MLTFTWAFLPLCITDVTSGPFTVELKRVKLDMRSGRRIKRAGGSVALMFTRQPMFRASFLHTNLPEPMKLKLKLKLKRDQFVTSND